MEPENGGANETLARRGRDRQPGRIPKAPGGWRSTGFDHHRLDVFWVAKEALRRGDAIARSLPRGYGSFADQLRRALVHAYCGITEASARTGRDRQARFCAARGEASEAAGVLEAVLDLELAQASEVEAVLELLARQCAMLTPLAGVRRRRF